MSPYSALAADIAVLDRLGPSGAPRRRVLQVRRRAERLRRCDLLPAWMRSSAVGSRATAPAPAPAPAASSSPAASRSQELELALAAKAQECGLPLPVLRQVLMRGLREYASLGRDVPLSAGEFAQGRVNSFLRLAEGDPEARCDDADLLALVLEVGKRPSGGPCAVSLEQSSERTE